MEIVAWYLRKKNLNWIEQSFTFSVRIRFNHQKLVGFCVRLIFVIGVSIFMEDWKTFRLRFMNRNLLILFISAFVFSLCALSSTIKSTSAVEIRHSLTGTTDFYLQKLEKAQDPEMKIEEINKGIMTSRRLLGGPGSWPPQCTSKCGGCTPCRAVHVPVPPGTPVTAEYYPEAWRCKCGNRLYLP